MAALSDMALVTQVAVFHNKKAFDQLVRKYQSPVRRFFLNQTLGDEMLSDDLAQETFIKAYVNITKFRGLSSFSTWLMRIAYNVFYDEKRKSRRVECEVSSEDTQLADIPSSTLHTPSSTLKMDIYAALALLKSDERTCITLQLIDGYPVEQISQITGIKENTVKSYLKRGKEKMTNYLRQNGYDR
ncbi:MAG: RNA polymerase sigma factor [Prevotella sp.]|nr:RNA polymerase sigma factor [Prevotella sp.]